MINLGLTRRHANKPGAVERCKEKLLARSKRWQDAFTVGQIVDALIPLATGEEWCRVRVIRKTGTGFPVVNVGTAAMVCDRKRDIRALREFELAFPPGPRKAAR